VRGLNSKATQNDWTSGLLHFWSISQFRQVYTTNGNRWSICMDLQSLLFFGWIFCFLTR
jgi:hypothetical protein